MAAKFVVLSLLIASAYGSGGYSSFSYGVSDPNTGDVKDQHEKRVGDNVVGKYSLLESDGTKRIVEYEANAQTGFNAIVRKEPAVGAHSSGSHTPLPSAPNGHGPLPNAAPTSVAPAIAPVQHPAPIAPATPQAHPGALANSGPLTHPGPLVHPADLPHRGYLPPSGALAHPAPLSGAFSGGFSHPGGFTLPGVLGHPGALGHPGTLSHTGAFGPLGHASPLALPSASHFAGNLAQPGFAGLNRHNLDGPQGVPAVSHFSQSVVHEAPRAFGGPYAGGYNGPYGGAYGGAYDGYGPYDRQGAFGGSLAHGLGQAPLGHGIAHGLAGNQGFGGSHGLTGPLGIAHSYSSLTRGEAYPHGYGGYGALGHGAGLGAAIGAGLAW